jgi:hypothetical protein
VVVLYFPPPRRGENTRANLLLKTILNRNSYSDLKPVFKDSKHPLFGYLCFEFCQKYKPYRYFPPPLARGEKIMKISVFREK